MSSTDIAGYLYDSNPFCTSCIGELFLPAEAEWVNDAPRPTEQVLDHVARQSGINRSDVGSFTSRQFPQPIYPDELSAVDACTMCGRPLGSTERDEDDCWP